MISALTTALPAQLSLARTAATKFSADGDGDNDGTYSDPLDAGQISNPQRPDYNVFFASRHQLNITA